jgi:hypothetical protein
MQGLRFEDWLQRAAHLRLSTIGGVSRPYKPAMLLAATMLIRKGQFVDNLLTLGELSPVFDQVLALVAPGSPPPSEHALPFRHLANDAIWELVPHEGEQTRLDAMRALGARARDVLQHTLGVQLPAEVFKRIRERATDAELVTRTVLRQYSPVFATWGLIDVHVAERTLLVWLGGAMQDPPPEPRTLTERVVEEWIQQHWAETPFAGMGLQLAGRQTLTPVNVIDLLAFDRARVEWWVFEIKRNNSSDSVVGQLARYRGWIAQAKQIPIVRARGVILTDVVSEKLQLAMRTQVGAELWRYSADQEISISRIDS